MSEGPVKVADVAAVGKRVRRMRAWQMVGLSVLLFASGGVTGWSVFRFTHQPPRDGGGMNVDRPEPPVEVMVDRMRHELGLSEEQVGKVREIYQKRFEELKGIRDAMKPKLMAAYEELKKEMEGVLSKEQFAEWDKRFEDVRNRMLPPPPPRRDGGPGRGPPGGPGRGGPPGGGMDGPPGGGPDGPPPGGEGPPGMR